MALPIMTDSRLQNKVNDLMKRAAFLKYIITMNTEQEATVVYCLTDFNYYAHLGNDLFRGNDGADEVSSGLCWAVRDGTRAIQNQVLFNPSCQVFIPAGLVEINIRGKRLVRLRDLQSITITHKYQMEGRHLIQICKHLWDNIRYHFSKSDSTVLLI